MGDEMTKNVIPAIFQGKSQVVHTLKGDPVNTVFAIVEVSSLSVSNELNGAINELYPQELQPRDRTSPASVEAVHANSNRLNLSQLSNSATSDSGSPIIGDDRVVESGNGRVMAMRKAYYEGRAQSYRERLEQTAEQFGIDADVVSTMTAPVLVRVRLTELDRAQFAIDSNHDNGPSSQGDRAVSVAMFESVSDDIEKAQSSNELKAALIGNTRYTDGPNELYELGISIIALLKPSVATKDIKKISEALRNLSKSHIARYIHYSEWYSALKIASQELFKQEKGNTGDWLKLLSGFNAVSDFPRYYADFSSDDYDTAARALEWKTLMVHKLKTLADEIELVKWLLDEPKLTKANFKKYIKATIDPLGFESNPISELITENQFIIDFVTAPLDNPVEMTAQEKLAIFNESLPEYYEDEITPLKGDHSIDDHVENVVRSSEQSKQSRLDKLAKSNHGYMAKEKKKKYIESLYAFEVGDGIREKSRAALTEYIENNVIPLPTYIGMGARAAIIDVENQRLYKPAIDAAYDYIDSVIDDYTPVSEKVAAVTKSVEKTEMSDGVTTETLKGYIAEMDALTSGFLPKINLECGDSFKGKTSKTRAYAHTDHNGVNIISVGRLPTKKTMWHECGHIIENNHPKIKAAALALLRSRKARATLKPVIANLKTYWPWCEKGEYIVNNFAVSPYETKFYTPVSKGATDFDYAAATELISKGFEWLADKKKAHRLMVDKVYFELIIAAIAYMKSEQP